MLTLSIFIFTLLILTTLFVRFKLSVNRSSELLANQKRIRTWWVIFVVCIPILYIGGWALAFLVYALIYWATFEFSRLQNIRISIVRILLLTLIIVSYDFSMRHFTNFANIFFLFPVLILIMSILFTTSRSVRAILLLLFCITSIQSLQLISQLSDKFGYDGGLILLYLFFITSVNDILQYLCGKLFGRKQLAPILSPNKTIEGALGGIFFTSLLFLFTLPNIVNVTWIEAILTGIIISTLGIMGDLTFSFYKRLADVKGSGSSLPGFGGLLDRIDSLTLTAPGFGFFLILVN